MDVKDEPFDICVIGGGINGVGIARDAAGRGLSVLLLEQDDLASGTSSRSGKLVHGGLRYLEYYEFRLVREALIEREVLMNSAPHIIWPMRFVLPHSPADRPAWLVRAGLFLYDHLGGRKRLPATRSLNLANAPEGEVLKPEFKRAFEYSDCWVDDARLVILNALAASEQGAVIKTRTCCQSARRVDDHWIVETLDQSTRQTSCHRARVLVNAAGPWVNRVIDSLEDVSASRTVRLVKGSHIVVDKFWDGEQAYLIQHTDKRVIFINPYEQGRALIGTTDIAYNGDPANVRIEDAEVEYLLAAVNRYFINQLSARDVQSAFSGVRPLYDDSAENPSAVTRDYLFDINGDSSVGGAPVLSVFGGKITTYRKLAEHAMDSLQGFLPTMTGPWTASTALPGGEIPNADFTALHESLCSEYPQLPADLLYHYGRLYGSRSRQLLHGIQTVEDLGPQFSQHLYAVEVHFLVRFEWAQTVDDILQRRTKHGLHMSKSDFKRFENWFKQENVVAI